MASSQFARGEMADTEGLRYVENPAGEHLLPCGDEAQGHWPAPMAPTLGKSYDHEDDHDYDHEHHHGKKSVLARVKEKAKKWRQMLAKKKHSHDEANAMPAWGVSLDEEDEGEEQDPEYHGAPMYESEMAPDAYKEMASQHQATIHSPKAPNSVIHQPGNRAIHQPSIGAKEQEVFHGGNAHKEPALHHLNAFKETTTQHTLTTPAITTDKQVSEAKSKQGDPINVSESSGNNMTLTETVTEMLAPAYNMVSDATHMIASKIQSPTAKDELGAKLMWDKGESMKEYLMHKLEPGEEERALSEVITEAISPRKAGTGQCEEMGVVEKVKGAVSSLLGMEERTGSQPVQVSAKPYQGSSAINVSARTHTSSSPIPVSSYSHSGSSPLPLSTDPHAEIEEVAERRLQAYTN